LILGFAMAAVAGFSLTAVAVWTGRPVVHGTPIALLILFWLAGRIAMVMPQWLPAPAIMLLDSLFPILLSLLFGREVISSRNRRNYGLVAVIVFMTLTNLGYHLGVLYEQYFVQRIAIYLLIHSMLLLVSVVAGRITPAFSRNWMKQKGINKLPEVRPRVDQLAFALTIATGFSVALFPFHVSNGIFALLAALTHGYRLSAWRGLATVSNPLLFVLHVAYAWIPIGYAMLASSLLGWTVVSGASLHVLTMGAIGFVVLAVTTRVSLGHTGRPLHASRSIVFAYWLMAIAVLVRLASHFAGSNAIYLINAAAAGWILVFAIFLWVHWPILTRARPQEEPAPSLNVTLKARK
jgi:uncharacterized protein involved in response to NO